MKTKFCALLFALAFAAGIGLPAAAADDASGVTSLSAMTVVRLSPKELAAIIGAGAKGETATPVVSGPGAGVVVLDPTGWNLTTADFMDATR